MRLLGLFADRREITAIVASPSGRVLERITRPGPVVFSLVQECWRPCDAACLSFPLGDPRDRQVAEDWAARLQAPVWLSSAREAVLAGALTWQPGVVVGEDHVMARDSTGRRQVWPHEASPAGLAGQLRQVAEAVPRVQREVVPGDLEAARKLLELADFPGPEPGCKAAVARVARDLCDVVRYGLGRSGFTEPPRACLAGPQFLSPLDELLQSEVRRHAPQLRWQAPRLPGVGGTLLLLASQLAHLRRQQPDAPELNLPAGVAWIAEDAWRQLGRERRPLPEWS